MSRSLTENISRGFTLIELLVILLIIGIVLSIVVVSVPNTDNKEIKELASSISKLLSLTRNNSILDNKVYRVILFDNHLDILEFQPPQEPQQQLSNQALDTSIGEPDNQLPDNWVSVLEEEQQIGWDNEAISVSLQQGGDDFLDQYQFKIENSFDKSFTEVVIFWPNGVLSSSGKLMFEDQQDVSNNLDVKWSMHGKIEVTKP